MAQLAPMTVTIRSTTRVPTAPSTPAAAAASAADADVEPQAPRAPRVKRAARRALRAIAGLAGAALLAAIVVRPIVARDGDAAGPAVSAPAAAKPAVVAPAAVDAERHRLRIGLSVRFPDGWREADGAPGDSTVVVRGAKDTEQGVFLAMVDGRDGDLIAAARDAERGVIGELGSGDASYAPAGCALVGQAGQVAGPASDRAGDPIGLCKGVAVRDGERVAVRTYVRAIGERRVVAVSIGAPDAAPVDALVSSLAP
jgi:hypothetical protein